MSVLRSLLLTHSCASVQVSKGRLEVTAPLHQRQLLGFADLAPGADKTLWVLYSHRGAHYEIQGALALLQQSLNLSSCM